MTTPGCPRNTLRLTRGNMGGTTWTFFTSYPTGIAEAVQHI